MSRRHITFVCEGQHLVGTLDEAPGHTGLLLVSGGNEVRAGPWNSQAYLAARLAAAGFPVMRFDRRGIGDSEGSNAGYRGSEQDIAAARAAFRAAAPQVKRVVGFGNCDAASALMLAGGAELDALVLSNPWTLDAQEDAVPSAVARAHYRRRLTDVAAVKRLLTGQVSIGKLVKALLAAAKGPEPTMNALTAELAKGISAFSGPVRFLVAGRDRTGLAFVSNWGQRDTRIRTCPEGSHSYVEPTAQEWLVDQLREVLGSGDPV